MDCSVCDARRALPKAPKLLLGCRLPVPGDSGLTRFPQVDLASRLLNMLVSEHANYDFKAPHNAYDFSSFFSFLHIMSSAFILESRNKIHLNACSGSSRTSCVLNDRLEKPPRRSSKTLPEYPIPADI